MRLYLKAGQFQKIESCINPGGVDGPLADKIKPVYYPEKDNDAAETYYFYDKYYFPYFKKPFVFRKK